jgi:hypothetical protein
VTKLTKLETEEKRIVRGATPEEELKAKQLSDEAHVNQKATKQLQVCKNQFHHKDTENNEDQRFLTRRKQSDQREEFAVAANIVPRKSPFPLLPPV